MSFINVKKNFPLLVIILFSTLHGFLVGEYIWSIVFPTRTIPSSTNPTSDMYSIFSKVLTFPEEQIQSKTSEDSRKTWNWDRAEKEIKQRRYTREYHKKLERVLYVVTPTVRGPSQIADLTRTAQALYPARKLVHWLIYEDSNRTRAPYPDHLTHLRHELADFVTEFLSIQIRWSGVRQAADFSKFNHKGVEGRRTGLTWIRKHVTIKGKRRGKGREWRNDGVLFFMDDDNTYDSDLFRQILTLTPTKSISAWPTGLVTPQTQLCAPVVNLSTGVAFDISDGWKVNRAFPLDFGGFAIPVKLLVDKPKVSIPYIAGYEESIFLNKLGVKLREIETLANRATEVLSYHSRTNYVAFQPDGKGNELDEGLTDKNTNIFELIGKYAATRSHRTLY